MIKFEVGKIYKHDVSRRTIKVLFASKNNMVADVLSGSNEGNDEWFATDTKDWREYKEPRKAEAWLNVYESRGKIEFGLTHETKEEALSVAAKRVIDTIKITWTEGQ